MDPSTGERLVNSKRPGLELVIGAHKSVAEQGVIGRAEDMHSIMDAERDATLGYFEDLTRRVGGRRGREATPTPTEGLTMPSPATPPRGHGSPRGGGAQAPEAVVSGARGAQVRARGGV